MRSVLVAAALLASSAAGAAPAQPYPWCAHYDKEGAATNCGFVTRDQCLATVSGIGGHCAPNAYAAWSAPQEPVRRKKRSHP